MIGDSLCSELRLLDDVRPIVRHHHERPGGTGYPDQLKGEDIPLLARILSVVDVYDALTTERPYKPALSPDHATRELREEAARGWKFEELVEEFVTLIAQKVFVAPLIQADVSDPAPVQQWRTPLGTSNRET